MLYGQPMAIPARHIRGIEARPGFRLDNDIFEYLVDGMADMYIAVGIGGAIVQHELGAAVANFANFLVEVFLLPGLEHDGLAFGEVAAHGKRRIRQVERLLIVSHER